MVSSTKYIKKVATSDMPSYEGPPHTPEALRNPLNKNTIPQTGENVKTEITGRRQDFETRKRVAEMTPEEMQSALLADELTGLKNKRAYAEAVKKPVQVKSDVDGLKWINDNYGKEAGNEKCCKEAGECYNTTGIKRGEEEV